MRAAKRTQQGAVAIMVALLLLVMLGMVGLALDLGQVYNRRVELQHVADVAALAAAAQLVGTSAGVASALASASTAVGQLSYQYGHVPATWSAAAIQFSAAQGGPWLDAASAQSAADGLLFARVDTSALDAGMGSVTTSFISLLAPSLASVSTSAVSVAGRSSINVVPLAICAMSNSAGAARPPANVELVQYGFRRGVAYDLMQLNSNGTTPRNFVIDPIDPPGAPGSAANMAAAVVGPFVCRGRMAMPRVMGGTITVQSPFPLASLYQQLNSRFDQYAGGQCVPLAAPPDTNIKSYTYSGPVSWMAAPSGQAAVSVADGANNKLWTKADLTPPASSGNTAAMYGVLWAYAKAAKWSSYTAGVPEPSGGYATFAASDWSSLYAPGAPTPLSYPSLTPYGTSGAPNSVAPSAAHRPGIQGRRVLNVPLLSCPVSGSSPASAQVLAVAKFFMTVPATATALVAEFAGIAQEQSLGGPLELYQ